jgi:hypothetical protein
VWARVSHEKTIPSNGRSFNLTRSLSDCAYGLEQVAPTDDADRLELVVADGNT